MMSHVLLKKEFQQPRCRCAPHRRHICLCMYVCTQPPKNLRNQTRKKKTKTKTKPKKINQEKTVAKIRLGNRNAQQITTDQSWWKLLKEIEVLGPRLRFEEHLQFCKASRSCDDRTRSGSCRACVRRRSALGTHCTNVAGVRRTIEGLAVVRWRPLKTKP